MKRILAVAAHPDDVSALFDQLRSFQESHRDVIVSVSDAASVRLLSQHRNFIESSRFFPTAKQIMAWQKKVLSCGTSWHLNKEFKRWIVDHDISLGRATELGIHGYLSEIAHSILTAERMVDRIAPDVIIVNRSWPESPFRRYQTDEFNLEARCVYLTARNRLISTIGLSGERNGLHPWIVWIRELLSSIAAEFRRKKSDSRRSRTDIPLVVLGNHYQLKNLEPLLERLRKAPTTFLVTGKTDADHERSLKRRGIPFVPFTALQTNMSPRFHTLRVFILYSMAWILCSHRLRNYFSSFHRLTWPLLEPKLQWYFWNEFPATLAVVRTGLALFSSRTRLFLTMATSDHLSRALALAAQRSGVRVAEMQHGLYLVDCEHPFRSNDNFLVWGESQRRHLFDGKKFSARFPFAGYPWFDQYRSLNPSDLGRWRKIGRNAILARPTQSVILVLASMPRDFDDERLSMTSTPFYFMNMVLKTIHDTAPSSLIVFRSHPGSSSDWVKPLARHLHVSMFYDDHRIALRDVIAASDLVIANFTTSLVDAMFIGKPILLYSFRKTLAHKVDQFDASTLGAWKSFDDPQTLGQLMTTYLRDRQAMSSMRKAQKTFLARQVPRRPDKGAMEIFSYIRHNVTNDG